MTKNIIALLIGIFVPIYIFCQTDRLYFRPTSEIRTYFSHADRNNPSPVPYYEYKTYPHKYMGGFELGFIAGFRFNKERMMIESGVKSSVISSGHYLRYFQYHINPLDSNHALYDSGLYGDGGGSFGTKIPLTFSLQLKEWKLHLYKPTLFTIHCHLMGGIVFYNQKTTGLGTISFGDLSKLISPTLRLQAVPSTHILTANAILYQAGFTFDLRKKQREWFTLTLHYMYGFRNLSSQRYNVTITDISTNTIIANYEYNSYSKGDGILLEVSKRIFFQHR